MNTFGSLQWFIRPHPFHTPRGICLIEIAAHRGVTFISTLIELLSPSPTTLYIYELHTEEFFYEKMVVDQLSSILWKL
jgi:hypothetical protein